MLLGIASNSMLKEVELNLSGNALGTGGSQLLEVCLPTVANISVLDLSDNGEQICKLTFCFHLLSLPRINKTISSDTPSAREARNSPQDCQRPVQDTFQRLFILVYIIDFLLPFIDDTHIY